jgi:hypothetical protein
MATPAARDARDLGWVPIPDPTILTTEQSNRLREEMHREFSALREVIDAKVVSMTAAVDVINRRVDEHYALLSKDIGIGELNRKEALDKAAVTVQTALDKAERALQVSLADAKKDLERSLTEAETRVDDKFNLVKASAKDFQAAADDVYSEKFSSIEKQFQERDTRTEQSASANKIAIDAAFLAQKAAADKAELTTKETIEGLQALFQSSIEPLRNQIAALTGRVDRGEGSSRGPNETEKVLSDLGRRIEGMGAKSAGEHDSSSKWMAGGALLVAVLVLVSQVLLGTLNHSPPSPAVSYAAPTVVSPAVVPVQPK